MRGGLAGDDIQLRPEQRPKQAMGDWGRDKQYTGPETGRVDVCKEGSQATVAGAEEHRLAVTQQ